MLSKLTFISTDYLKEYIISFPDSCLNSLQTLNSAPEFSSEDFDYYIIASSLYSSKIEGNTLDADSFFRNRGKSTSPKKKEVQEIEELVEAYKFASENTLTKSNFLKTHSILSKSLLPKKEQGKVRKEQVGVRDSKTLKPIYLAVEPEFVDVELTKLFSDISMLLEEKLTIQEVFYFASIIHLWIAKIHPFMDGNGRSARLIEKWFLVSKLGKSLWSVNSEKYYWDNRPAYYENISLGFNYYALYWERCQPFLKMLVDSIGSK
jgi:Fic family protein